MYQYKASGWNRKRHSEETMLLAARNKADSMTPGSELVLLDLEKLHEIQVNKVQNLFFKI